MTDTPPGPENRTPPDRLTIGRIVAPHGVRGELRMFIYTQFPERIPELPYVYIGSDGQRRKILRARFQGNLVILRVEDITDREMADELRNELVQIDLEHSVPLDEGEYFHFELIGLTAFDETGNRLGQVTEILETGANDVYVIRDDEGKEMLVPALEDVVPEIDVEAGRMVVRPLRYSDEG